MDVLLRHVHERAGGAVEFHDAEVRVDQVMLGSAPDQTIQLLGANVAARHAAIKGARLECTRGRTINVDGEAVASATLRIGAVIELDGHRLTVVPAPGGFDLALEVRRNAEVSASTFERAFRTDLDQTFLSRRPAAWMLGVLTLLLFALAPLLVVELRPQDVTAPSPRFAPSDAMWSSGPLTPAHHMAAGERCDVCHQQLFQRVQDGACQHCHDAVHAHVNAATLAKTTLGPTDRCAVCHREHKEPSIVSPRDNGVCTDCHATSEKRFGSLTTKAVSGFDAQRHPEFQAHLLKPVNGADAPVQWAVQITPLDGAQEQSNLKFSHTQHMDASKVLRRSDSEPLGCADCHRLSEDGEHFRKITMQDSCSGCHELTFDPAAPDRQLPHGKPREVVLTLQDYFTRKFTDPNPPAIRERRRIPGHEELEEKCTGPAFACAMSSARKETEAQFARRGCVSCHDVVDTGADDLLDRFRVSPVRLALDYFPTSHFSHRAHRVQGKLTGDAACQSCHKAKESEASSDLLIPGLANCAQCHSDTPRWRAGGANIQLQCVSCHGYHPKTADTPVAAQTADNR